MHWISHSPPCLMVIIFGTYLKVIAKCSKISIFVFTYTSFPGETPTELNCGWSIFIHDEYFNPFQIFLRTCNCASWVQHVEKEGCWWGFPNFYEIEVKSAFSMKIGRASKVVVATFYKVKLVDRFPKFLRNWEFVYESSKIGTEPSPGVYLKNLGPNHV